MHFVTKYATQETLDNEELVGAFIQKVWGVDLHPRGQYDPIDWDIYKDGDLVGVGELKNYKRTARQEPTVILNVRKYIALRDWHLHSTGELPAFYFVNFLDELRYIDVMAVNPTFPQMGGQRGGPRSTDWEPVYKVPVSSMNLLAKKGTPNV
jgi:hypothetical protein